MNTVIDDYKLREITDNTDTITIECLAAAESRVSSYLHNRYDTVKIFSATGFERHPEIVAIVKNIALYFICRRHNIDIIFERVKEAYNADIAYLTALSKGTISANYPLRLDSTGSTKSTLRMGSNTKFDHEY
ncbi:hypothetical protein B7P34_36425, partial [Streptosporangium nondiastaticum]